MKSTTKKDIKFGGKDLLAVDEFDPKYGKERITLFIDQQVVDAFRSLAEKRGDKYQALMREALRGLVYSDSKVDSLEKRISKIEKVLFKKKTRD